MDVMMLYVLIILWKFVQFLFVRNKCVKQVSGHSQLAPELTVPKR